VFARNARTREGQLQVDLAQHQYLLPRLRGQWSHLERLGGGIGTRGPGETQLETDRRLINARIQKLKEQIETVRRHRSQYIERRHHHGVAVASLVGYTNAGKSTLFNALTRAGVVAENKLFATLDPVTRQLHLPTGRNVLLTDTVGFINKLPPAVVAAFRATLEELRESDLLLHVIDVSHPKAAEQARVVEETLDDLGIGEKPQLLALNKVDVLSPDPDSLHELEERGLLKLDGPVFRDHPHVLVSAARGWGLERLLAAMGGLLRDAGRAHPHLSMT
jgi:GTP-binding protein HflX